MIFPVPESILASQVAVAAERLALFLSDPDTFRDLIAKGLVRHGSRNPSEKADVAKMGMFSAELLQATICAGEEDRMDGIDFVWTRLIEARIVSKFFAYMPTAFADHMIDRYLLATHLRDDTFKNLFAPASSLVSRYAASILAIDVERLGVPMRGSGFILLVDGHPMIITCRHNVDPAEEIAITSITNGDGIALAVPNFACHDRFDLAVGVLGSGVMPPYFRSEQRMSVFDETFTIGYPDVPLARSSLVGHRGEINGFAEIYLNKCPVVLISNLVSPGSSGCPVLLRDGHIAGMTIQWLEAEYGKGVARFSAALPAEQIVAFVRLQLGA